MKKMLVFVVLTVCMFAINAAAFAAFNVNAFEASLEECD